MGKIRRLSKHLIDQIKAGEVVERPASVVKELVENSLDSGAKRICVELLDGGRQLIRITDDGCGMGAEDLDLSLERHATSKLSRIEDLTNLVTLGFRGEALPSIAAVSRFSMRSRTKEVSVGLEINVIDGEKSAPTQIAMPVGTVVTVRDLFANIPARLKFLRATATEFAHIQELLIAIALSRPAVGFCLTHNGRTVFDYQAQQELRARFSSVIGEDASGYVAVEFARGSFKIVGFAALPEHARPIARQFVTFINGRYVKDRTIRAGVLQAYAGLIMKGLVPSVALFVEVDPSWVDVNASPSKTEVRFRDPAVVQDLITIAVQNSVKQATQERVFESPVSRRETVVHSRADFSAPNATRIVQKSVHQVPRVEPVVLQATEIVKSDSPICSANYLGQYANCYLLFQVESELWIVDQHAFHERILFEDLLRNFENKPLPKQEMLAPVVRELPFGVADLVAAEADALERLGFRVESLDADRLAIHSWPAILDFKKAEDLFEEVLARLLIAAELPVAPGHPLQMKQQRARTSLADGEISLSDLDRGAVFHLCLATMACHAAVRAGEPLNQELVRRLLLQAGNVDFFAHCPHGRPVVRKFSPQDVAAWFLRI